MISRRALLRFAAASAACAAGPGVAEEKQLPRLIQQARKFDTVGRRIAFISRAYLGRPYVANSLIGSATQPERFVVREDAFDCVTYCETILAAARAQSSKEFNTELRKIRYREGRIDWYARNHYFIDWSIENIANGVCRAVVLPGAEKIAKNLTYMHQPGARPVSFMCNPRGEVFAYARRLATGDIAAFVSLRPGLDFYHAGFIVVQTDGALWLRHASLSQGRVLEQPLAQFCDMHGVRLMTLLRPQEVLPVDTIL
jgi:N-acetylmuramoyl-L-alanine amidase-like